MTRLSLAILAIAGLLLTHASASAQRGREREARGAGRNGWESSLAAGLREARQTGKPLMVVLRCEP
jgi:hypothetical protein